MPQNQAMNQEQNSNKRNGYGNFRNSLDLGMGIFYILIGALVIYAKYFGSLELSPTYANLFGGLVIFYGLFRVYRGISNFRKIKQEK